MPEHKILPRSLLLEPPLPLRAAMDQAKLDELIASIKTLGILEPLLVTPRLVDADTYTQVVAKVLPNIDDSPRQVYEIIDGHRRYIAAGVCGLTEVPCIIFDNVEETKLQIMVDATMVREDVTAAEEGLLYLQLCELHGWSIDQLCKRFSRSAGYINDRVYLVRGDPKVAEAVARREISFGVARILLKCKDAPHRAYLLDMARTHGCNTRTVELWVTQWKQNEAIQNNGGAPAPPQPMPVFEAPPPPRCLWCTHEDNPEDMVPVMLHRWHVRDLTEWLLRTGIHTSPTTSSPVASENAPAVT